MALIDCPECRKQVSDAAASCPTCGHPIRFAPPPLRSTYSSAPPQAAWSPGIAAVLSLVIPGAGQMYKGAVGAGLIWFVFVSIGYVCFILPGLILHLICIFNAAAGSSAQQ